MTSAEIKSGTALQLSQIPSLPMGEYTRFLSAALASGAVIHACFAMPARRDKTFRLFAVLGYDRQGLIRITSAETSEGRFPSLAAAYPQMQLFEREIHEQWGLMPEGHPWLKPVRFHRPFTGGEGRKVLTSPDAVGIMDYYRVEGADVHEVAVGPVHAGVIEPGHFRFQCLGEKVMHLEISLGYQHRGIERRLRGGPDKLTPILMETAAGDSSVAHSLAYAMNIEALGGAEISPEAHALRSICLELERLANHTGDLGALSGDVAFLPTMSYCGRLRGDFLNLTALICGNRFGRAMLRPGGVLRGMDKSRLDKFSGTLQRTYRDVNGALDLLWNSNSAMERFRNTGRVDGDTARRIGLVGVAARAGGIGTDVRSCHPFGIYRDIRPEISIMTEGDVHARAYVRKKEIDSSVKHINAVMARHPDLETGESLLVPVGKLNPESVVVSLVEGWRGEICHVCVTDGQGRFKAYKIVDPSFHNWTGLAMALRETQISDFPLCNKSFNLSYCGFDL